MRWRWRRVRRLDHDDDVDHHDATVKATTTTSSTSTTSTTVPETIRQPLTGEPLASADEILARPALVAKIDNNPPRRRRTTAGSPWPTSCSRRSSRDARRASLRCSTPRARTRSVPIRSGRTQDVDLASSFNSPLFVWSGGNAGVTRLINEAFLINMGPNNASGYYRGPGRAPHNLFNSTDDIWAQTPPDHPGPPGQQYQYLDEGEAVDGTPTAGVEVRVGGENIAWTWNPDEMRFDRSQRGRPHDDSLFGRIRSTNVVVMGVEYRPSAVDRASPEAQTIGEGPVWIFTDGQVREGIWKRELNVFSLEFFDVAGDPIELAPGNTWIELADIDDVLRGGVQVLPATPPSP
jgi:hypothetical protein